MEKSKGQQFGESAINKMFQIAGYDHTFESLDLLNRTDDWYEQYQWNYEQETTFKEWYIERYSKTFNVPKYEGMKSAERNFMSFNLNYGLKRSDFTPPLAEEPVL